MNGRSLGRASCQSPKPKGGAEGAEIDSERAAKRQSACHEACSSQACAAALSLLQRKLVPSIHMRWRITAILRATATLARFMPRLLATSRPVLTQKPIRSQSAAIRNRDCRPCSEICRFSESGHLDRQHRDLDRRRAYGHCPTKQPRDLLSSWLRRRDVRTDDAVHRPREVRRSRQLKAVGSDGGPDNPCLMTDAFYSYDNSENSKTKRDVGASH
jgi:hypothetical protein